MTYILYSQDLKKQVLEAIKFQGLLVKDAAIQFGVHHKTIYGWISKEGTTPTIKPTSGLTRNKSDILLIAKLEQENQQLKELLGSTILDVSKFKKKYSMPN